VFIIYIYNLSLTAKKVFKEPNSPFLDCTDRSPSSAISLRRGGHSAAPDTRPRAGSEAGADAILPAVPQPCRMLPLLPPSPGAVGPKEPDTSRLPRGSPRRERSWGAEPARPGAAPASRGWLLR